MSSFTVRHVLSKNIPLHSSSSSRIIHRTVISSSSSSSLASSLQSRRRHFATTTTTEAPPATAKKDMSLQQRRAAAKAEKEVIRAAKAEKLAAQFIDVKKLLPKRRDYYLTPPPQLRSKVDNFYLSPCMVWTRVIFPNNSSVIIRAPKLRADTEDFCQTIFLDKEAVTRPLWKQRVQSTEGQQIAKWQKKFGVAKLVE